MLLVICLLQESRRDGARRVAPYEPSRTQRASLQAFMLANASAQKRKVQPCERCAAERTRRAMQPAAREAIRLRRMVAMHGFAAPSAAIVADAPLPFFYANPSERARKKRRETMPCFERNEDICHAKQHVRAGKPKQMFGASKRDASAKRKNNDRFERRSRA